MTGDQVTTCPSMSELEHHLSSPYLYPGHLLLCELQECGPGKLMLYGGIGADNKPLNDAWVLDLEKLAWSLIYMAHSDLCPPQVLV